MIEPKKRFEEQAKAAGWRWLDTADAEMFQSAALAALAQMTINNSGPPDMASAASYAWRLEGAKQFLAILTGLTEVAPKRAPVSDRMNVNHGV